MSLTKQIHGMKLQKVQFWNNTKLEATIHLAINNAIHHLKKFIDVLIFNIFL
jgi:hypothetical protein